jgi:hypothetical protein
MSPVFAGAGTLDVIEAIPAPKFQHLRRMTDHVGLWEHAKYTIPRSEHGYCTDDNARALILLSREVDPPAELIGLARVYFRIVADAAHAQRGFQKRRGANEACADEIGSDDSH